MPSSGWTGSRAASLTRDAMVSPSRRGGGSHSARVLRSWQQVTQARRSAQPCPGPRALLKSPRPLQGLALICPSRSRWLGSRRTSQRSSFPGQNGCRLPGTSGVEATSRAVVSLESFVASQNQNSLRPSSPGTGLHWRCLSQADLGDLRALLLTEGASVVPARDVAAQRPAEGAARDGPAGHTAQGVGRRGRGQRRAQLLPALGAQVRYPVVL